MTIASGGGDYDDYCLRWSTTKQPTRALLRHPSKSDHFPAKPKVTRIKIIIHHCQIHDICIHKCPWSTSPPFPRHQFSGSPPPWRTLLTHGRPLVQVVHRCFEDEPDLGDGDDFDHSNRDNRDGVNNDLKHSNADNHKS